MCAEDRSSHEPLRARGRGDRRADGSIHPRQSDPHCRDVGAIRSSARWRSSKRIEGGGLGQPGSGVAKSRSGGPTAFD